jgi:hypothetical protein
MGEIVHMHRKPSSPRTPPGPRHRVSLREKMRRVEVIAALVADCGRRLAGSRMTCAIASTPRGGPVSERTWTIAIVDEAGRSHPFFHPVHSDDLDMFAGAVRAGLSHWTDVVSRRLSMHAVVPDAD